MCCVCLVRAHGLRLRFSPKTEVVGRFLAILELYKAQAVSVEQEESLGDLKIAWTGLNVDPAVVAASNWA